MRVTHSSCLSAVLLSFSLLLAGCAKKEPEPEKSQPAQNQPAQPAQPSAQPAPAQPEPSKAAPSAPPEKKSPAAAAKTPSTAQPAQPTPAPAVPKAVEPARPVPEPAPAKPAEMPPAPAKQPPAPTQAPKLPSKDTFILKAALGGVKFEHKKHATERAPSCDVCHHASRPEKPAVAPQACGTCHTSVAASPMKTKLQAAFHNPMATQGTCIDCHKVQNTQGKKAPVKCLDCHKKENS